MSHVAYIGKRLERIVVEAPYNPKWARAINAVVPAKDRTRTGNVWTFDLRWHFPVVYITEKLYVHVSNTSGQPGPVPDEIGGWTTRWDTVRGLQGDAQELRLNPVVADARSQLFVTHDAPLTVVRAAYRALVKTHHPDVGGDPDQFKLIQRAYEHLCSD